MEDRNRRDCGGVNVPADALEDPSRRRQSLGWWLAAVAAVLFSAKAILAKILYRYGIDAVTLITLRMAFAFPVFGSVAWLETRRAMARGDRLSMRERGQIGLLGLLGYYLSSHLDFWGLEYIPVALERIILFLTPTLVMLFVALFLRRKATVREWLAVVICYGGVVLVFWGQGVDGQISRLWLGSSLVFGATASYAVYLLLSGSLVRRVGSLRLVAYAMSVSTLACLVQFLILRPVDSLIQEWPVYGWSVLNALLCTVMPVYLTMFAIARIGPAATAQMSFTGPLALLFLGWWLLDEQISVLQLLGSIVVLGGVLVLTRPVPPKLNQSAD
jgi:drug/metabolite transporter (DMT)-like permease